MRGIMSSYQTWSLGWVAWTCAACNTVPSMDEVETRSLFPVFAREDRADASLSTVSADFHWNRQDGPLLPLGPRDALLVDQLSLGNTTDFRARSESPTRFVFSRRTEGDVQIDVAAPEAIELTTPSTIGGVLDAPLSIAWRNPVSYAKISLRIRASHPESCRFKDKDILPEITDTGSVTVFGKDVFVMPSSSSEAKTAATSTQRLCAYELDLVRTQRTRVPDTAFGGVQTVTTYVQPMRLEVVTR
jgi:hypothetical protein